MSEIPTPNPTELTPEEEDISPDRVKDIEKARQLAELGNATGIERRLAVARLAMKIVDKIARTERTLRIDFPPSGGQDASIRRGIIDTFKQDGAALTEKSTPGLAKDPSSESLGGGHNYVSKNGNYKYGSDPIDPEAGITQGEKLLGTDGREYDHSTLRAAAQLAENVLVNKGGYTDDAMNTLGRFEAQLDSARDELYKK